MRRRQELLMLDSCCLCSVDHRRRHGRHFHVGSAPIVLSPSPENRRSARSLSIVIRLEFYFYHTDSQDGSDLWPTQEVMDLDNRGKRTGISCPFYSERCSPLLESTAFSSRPLTDFPLASHASEIGTAQGPHLPSSSMFVLLRVKFTLGAVVPIFCAASPTFMGCPRVCYDSELCRWILLVFEGVPIHVYCCLTGTPVEVYGYSGLRTSYSADHRAYQHLGPVLVSPMSGDSDRKFQLFLSFEGAFNLSSLLYSPIRDRNVNEKRHTQSEAGLWSLHAGFKHRVV